MTELVFHNFHDLSLMSNSSSEAAKTEKSAEIYHLSGPPKAPYFVRAICMHNRNPVYALEVNGTTLYRCACLDYPYWYNLMPPHPPQVQRPGDCYEDQEHSSPVTDDAESEPLSSDCAMTEDSSHETHSVCSPNSDSDGDVAEMMPVETSAHKKRARKRCRKKHKKTQVHRSIEKTWFQVAASSLTRTVDTSSPEQTDDAKSGETDLKIDLNMPDGALEQTVESEDSSRQCSRLESSVEETREASQPESSPSEKVPPTSDLTSDADVATKKKRPPKRSRGPRHKRSRDDDLLQKCVEERRVHEFQQKVEDLGILQNAIVGCAVEALTYDVARPYVQELYFRVRTFLRLDEENELQMDHCRFHRSSLEDVAMAYRRFIEARTNSQSFVDGLNNTSLSKCRTLKMVVARTYTVQQLCDKMIIMLKRLTETARADFGSNLASLFPDELSITRDRARCESYIEQECGISHKSIPKWRDDLEKCGVSILWPKYPSLAKKALDFNPFFVWGLKDDHNGEPSCSQCHSLDVQTVLVSCCNTEQLLCLDCKKETKWTSCVNVFGDCFGTRLNLHRLLQTRKQEAILSKISARYNENHRLTQERDRHYKETGTLTNWKHATYELSSASSFSDPTFTIVSTLFPKVSYADTGEVVVIK